MFKVQDGHKSVKSKGARALLILLGKEYCHLGYLKVGRYGTPKNRIETSQAQAYKYCKSQISLDAVEKH